MSRQRPTTQPSFGQFKQRPIGDEGDYVAVPEAGRTYFPGTTVTAIGARYVQRSDGLIVPESAARPPQPIDLIQTYVTYSEVFGVPAPSDYLVDALKAVPRDAFVQWCAVILGAYEKLSASRHDVDIRLADAWFNEPAKGKVLALLRDHYTLVAPQALLLLMQIALVRSPMTVDPDTRSHSFPALILAIQDQLGSSGDGEETVFTGDPHSVLFRQIVASHHFGETGDEATTIAHHHERWVRLSRLHAGQPGACDLYQAFRDATGVDKNDFTAIGLAIWANCETQGTYPIAAAALDSFKMTRDVVDNALSLISATAQRVRSRILNMPEEFRTEWSVDVLRQFPLLRLENGDIVVLSKRLLIDRIYGWLPMFDLIEGLKAKGRKKEAERADTWFRHLCELDARAGLENLAGPSRFYGDEDIQHAFGTAAPNADAAVEYPDAWVVIEIGTHQLTRATVVATDPGALESDLKHGIDEKAEQLDSTIRALIADEAPLTGRGARERRRYVAVLVLTEGFPVNPMTSTAMRERILRAGLFADARVGPLHVIDQEELDMVEAISEEGGPSLLGLLEDHERSSLASSALKDWLILERGRGIGPRRPRRLEAVRAEAWQPAIERLRTANGRDGDSQTPKPSAPA